MTDLHALIHRMADELDHNRQCLLDDRRVTHPLADKARAALAEPADGEVAELVLWLREEADDYDCIGETLASPKCRRAADLLERLSPPQPIPVSERWPEFSDCDSAERVWCWSWAIGTWRFSRINQSIHSHWLPAYALPLPGQP